MLFWKIKQVSCSQNGLQQKTLSTQWGTGTNTITLKKDKLTLEGTCHVKSLHIMVEYRGMIISRVLIDNEAPLNVCPTMTLSRIGVEDSMIRPKGMIVHAFDDTKTFICDKIDLKILFSPSEFEVPFVVIDIVVVFNLLIGRH